MLGSEKTNFLERGRVRKYNGDCCKFDNNLQVDDKRVSWRRNVCVKNEGETRILILDEKKCMFIDLKKFVHARNAVLNNRFGRQGKEQNLHIIILHRTEEYISVCW